MACDIKASVSISHVPTKGLLIMASYDTDKGISLDLSKEMSKMLFPLLGRS